jgi:hypothetical protein
MNPADKAVASDPTDLIDRAAVVIAINNQFVKVGPSGCTGYEERGAHNDGVRKALDAIENLPAVAVPTEATQRKYFCSCGMPCTAEEYIEHYFEKGHDRGEGAQVAVEAVGDTYSAKRAAIEIADALRSADEGWRNKPTYHEFEAIISKHCSADTGEVERGISLAIIQTQREWRIWLWNEFQIDVEVSNNEARDQLRARFAEARANAIRECVEKVAETRNHLAAARYTDSQRVVMDMFIHKLKSALESLTKKEGEPI